MKKTIFGMMAAAFLLPTIVSAQTEEVISKKVPSFSVQTTDGKKVDFAEQIVAGKTNVISFWATWCAPCKKELNNIKAIYPEWQEKYNVNLIAVSIDDTRNFSKVKTYVDGQRWEFTTLVDTNSDSKRNLNFQMVPHTIIVDKNGNIVWEHDGYTEGDEFELEKELEKLK